VIFSSALANSYAGVTFACVDDSVDYYLRALHHNSTTSGPAVVAHDLNRAINPEAEKWLLQIRQCLSDIQYSVESATLNLEMRSYGLGD
jgi:hypothetical protein